MRLLNVYTLGFEEFHGDDIPPYVIASHRWGNAEPSYDTFQDRQRRQSDGYKKVAGFCFLVRQRRPNVQWLWIDTCCIDKKNSVELHEAINSMFRWYQQAVRCYAYLQDVHGDSSPEFGRSAWFTRSWTLQELLAPPEVAFIRSDWQVIGCKTLSRSQRGTKSDPELQWSLNTEIAAITGILQDVVSDFDTSHRLSVEERMSWMSRRRTTRPEDKIYSMLGIFGVYMSLIYGEGSDHAMKRLLKEIKDPPESAQVANYGDTIMDLGTGLAPASNDSSAVEHPISTQTHENQAAAPAKPFQSSQLPHWPPEEIDDFTLLPYGPTLRPFPVLHFTTLRPSQVANANISTLATATPFD